jgi:phi13 family phage major tail protein
MTKEDTAAAPPEYDTPVVIGEATTANVTPTVQNVPAYADGVIVEQAVGSPGGTVALGIHALKLEDAKILFGAKFDSKGALISSSGDTPPYGALLFESVKGNGKTRYVVLYKVKFQPQGLTLNTKTDTVTWQQPTLNASYQSRMDIYVDENGKKDNLLKAEYDEDAVNFDATVAQNWYKKVYEPTPPKVVTGVTLDETTASIAPAATKQLTATITPADASNKAVTWQSSDTDVATVNNTGLVTGIAAGTCQIKATTVSGGKEASCEVTVQPVAVTGVTLDKDTLDLTVGETRQLTATVAPINATNKTVTWESGDTDIATVSADGLVTAVAEGTADITVKTVDGNMTDTCSVTVTAS